MGGSSKPLTHHGGFQTQVGGPRIWNRASGTRQGWAFSGVQDCHPSLDRFPTEPLGSRGGQGSCPQSSARGRHLVSQTPEAISGSRLSGLGWHVPQPCHSLAMRGHIWPPRTSLSPPGPARDLAQGKGSLTFARWTGRAGAPSLPGPVVLMCADGRRVLASFMALPCRCLLMCLGRAGVQGQGQPQASGQKGAVGLVGTSMET